MKKVYVILALAILLVTGALYFATLPLPQDENGKARVTASFFPLFFYAQAISGGTAEVSTLTPSGVEPHDYEPTPRDIARLEASDLLLLNGAGVEPWAENIQDVLQSNTLIVKVGENLATRTVEEGGVEVQDPHVWLDPLLAKQEADRIREAFIKIDPANRDDYERNAAALNAKFDALDQAFREGLKTCSQRKIFTSHAAFGYLAAAYDLEQVALTGISPENEPSSQDLARIAELARTEKVHYIFFETLVSPKLAETIAREVGAQTLVLDPIESGTDYFAQMYENLKNLKIALACQK